MLSLPNPFEWCSVPAGHTIMPHGEVAIPDFYVAKYPITNAQYAVFASADDGYAHAEWWDYSPGASAFRADTLSPPHTAIEGDDLPRTNVSWYEAIAFCRWLSARQRAAIRLPSAAEWQRAAQVDTNWRYPWGDMFDPERCNFNTLTASPVQAHPQGASPCGALDMSGNVWEWCLDDYDSGNIDTALATPIRVVKGGSWWCTSSELFEVRYYSGGYPEGWSHDWGFRIVMLR